MPRFFSLLILQICAVLAIAAAGVSQTSLYVYNLSDVTRNNNYAAGKVENHCFDETPSGVKTYVRGTYGNYGYFEGAASANDPMSFLVNWYETSSGTMVPTSGSAYLTYSSDWSQVTGPYWASGASDLMGSWGAWNSNSGWKAADDLTTQGANTILTTCLYAGVNAGAHRSNIKALNNVMSVSGHSGQGTNDFCEVPVGQVGGAWIGSYQYIYDAAHPSNTTEDGNYGTNPFGFWVQSGFGFTGLWYASTGPYAKTYGSNLYMTVSDKKADPVTVGFYCNVKGKFPNIQRTACFPEYYTVHGVDWNKEKCPAYYRLDGSLDPLFEFAAIGKSNHKPKN